MLPAEQGWAALHFPPLVWVPRCKPAHTGSPGAALRLLSGSVVAKDAGLPSPRPLGRPPDPPIMPFSSPRECSQRAGGTSTRLGWQFSPPVPPLACPQGTGAAGVGEAWDGAGQSHSLLTQGVPGTSAGPRSWFGAQTDVLHTWPMGHIPMLGDGGQGSPLPQFPLWYRRRMTSRLRNVLSTGMGRWTAEPQSQGTAPGTVNPAGGGSGSGVSGGPEPLSAKALTLKGGHGGPG